MPRRGIFEMPEETVEQTEGKAPPDGAKEFLLQEYQGLVLRHQAAKEEGEKRLNFYVAFVAAAGTVLVGAKQFIVDKVLYLWLLLGGIVLTLCLGLITFQKMLQRRDAVVIFRRRISRIRAWFLKYYPSISHALPFDVSQDIPIDWAGGKLGTTAFSVALINTMMVVLATISIVTTALDFAVVWWVLPIAAAAGAVTWWFHRLWKDKWIEQAEMRDKKEMLALDRLSSEVSIDEVGQD
jgi:hypothetical protein